MFRRRRNEPAPEAAPPDQSPSPMTIARPSRHPAGMGLRARPGGFGSRLREILGAGAPATESTWDDVEEALIAADVGGTATLPAASRSSSARRASGCSDWRCCRAGSGR